MGKGLIEEAEKGGVGGGLDRRGSTRLVGELEGFCEDRLEEFGWKWGEQWVFGADKRIESFQGLRQTKADWQILEGVYAEDTVCEGVSREIWLD